METQEVLNVAIPEVSALVEDKAKNDSNNKNDGFVRRTPIKGGIDPRVVHELNYAEKQYRIWSGQGQYHWANQWAGYAKYIDTSINKYKYALQQGYKDAYAPTVPKTRPVNREETRLKRERYSGDSLYRRPFRYQSGAC